MPPGAGGGRRYDIEWECSNAEGGKRVDTQVSLLTFRELRSAFLKKETLSPDHDDFGSDLSILWSTSILLTYYETVGDQRWDRLLNQMMNDACAEVEEAETEWETMTIPESCVGLVIGKNGAAVKQLQEKSGAYIEVQRDDEHEVQARDAPAEAVGRLGHPSRLRRFPLLRIRSEHGGALAQALGRERLRALVETGGPLVRLPAPGRRG